MARVLRRQAYDGRNEGYSEVSGWQAIKQLECSWFDDGLEVILSHWDDMVTKMISSDIRA